MKYIKNYEEVAKELFYKMQDCVYSRKSRVKRSLSRLIQNVGLGLKKARTLVKSYYKLKLASESSAPKIRTGALIILPFMVNKLVKVYNGKTYVTLKIFEESLGRYLGEFIETRKQGVHTVSKKAAKIKKS